MEKQLFDLKPGTRFTYGEVEWVLLDMSGPWALALTAAARPPYRPFDMDSKNNWTYSTLRADLNGPFLDGMVRDGADRSAFCLFNSDLTADDGCRDYGETTDKIALLTCDIYREFRDLIPVIEERWWTLTPLTCFQDRQQIVRNIGDGGEIESNFLPNCLFGVRPFCHLKADTAVTVQDDAAAEDETAAEVQPSRAEIVEEASDAVLSVLADYPVDLWGDVLGAAVASLYASKREAEEIRAEEAERKKDNGGGG